MVLVRGFSAYLSVTESVVSYPFTFPNMNKRPPIEIIKLLILFLRQKFYLLNFIRLDEGCELARSAEINRFFVE